MKTFIAILCVALCGACATVAPGLTDAPAKPSVWASQNIAEKYNFAGKDDAGNTIALGSPDYNGYTCTAAYIADYQDLLKTYGTATILEHPVPNPKAGVAPAPASRLGYWCSTQVEVDRVAMNDRRKSPQVAPAK